MKKFNSIENSTRLTAAIVSTIAGIISVSTFAYPKASNASFFVRTGTVDEERAFSIPLDNGKHQRVLFDSPPHPRAVIIMFPGGAGDIGLGEGLPRHGDNFVVRTHAMWVSRGFAVLIPDTVDRANQRGTRSSPQYATLISKLVDFANSQVRRPVFLLGTSQGSIAAMNGAAHLQKGEIAGVILTESVSLLGGSHETVFNAQPDLVRVPALIVANRDDRCNVAPPQMAPRIAAAISNSPDVRVLYVSGGVNRSHKACGSLTPHGYYGIEHKVVGDIAHWIDSHLSDER